MTGPAYVLATTDAELLDWLTGPTRLPALFGGQTIAERTETGARIIRLDLLRTLTENEDGNITDDENGVQMWVEGDPHPLTLEQPVAELPALTGRNPDLVRLAESDRRNLLALLEKQIAETAGDIPADALAELTAIYRDVILRHTDAGWWLNDTGRRLGVHLQREFTAADKARLAALRERVHG